MKYQELDAILAKKLTFSGNIDITWDESGAPSKRVTIVFPNNPYGGFVAYGVDVMSAYLDMADKIDACALEIERKASIIAESVEKIRAMESQDFLHLFDRTRAMLNAKSGFVRRTSYGWEMKLQVESEEIYACAGEKISPTEALITKIESARKRLCQPLDKLHEAARDIRAYVAENGRDGG